MSVDLAHADLSHRNEPEEQHQRCRSLQNDPCVLVRRRNSSFNRSIVFVVRSARHWLGGNCMKVSSSSPASSRLFTTSADSLLHFRTNAWYAARAAGMFSAYTIAW